MIKKVRKYFTIAVLCLFVIMLSRCIYVDGVDQPGTIQSGDILTSVIHVRINSIKGESGTRLVVGFLAPKKWNAAANATMSYTSNFGNGGMSMVPKGSQPAGSGGADWPTIINNKAGIGKNKIRDLEWVVFWSDQSYNVANGDNIFADVKVVVKTGEQNVVVDLGYFAASTKEDINGGNAYGVQFATLETTGGSGPVINFLVPQLSLVNPLQNLDNEFLTLSFDGSIVPTDLTDAPQVYLCATAYTSDNQVITICGNDDTSKMTGTDRDKWRIDMWPRKYFNIQDGQTISKMEYYFTNAAGNLSVKQPDTGLPFTYVFACP